MSRGGTRSLGIRYEKTKQGLVWLTRISVQSERVQKCRSPLKTVSKRINLLKVMAKTSHGPKFLPFPLYFEPISGLTYVFQRQHFPCESTGARISRARRAQNSTRCINQPRNILLIILFEILYLMAHRLQCHSLCQYLQLVASFRM